MLRSGVPLSKVEQTYMRQEKSLVIQAGLARWEWAKLFARGHGEQYKEIRKELDDFKQSDFAFLSGDTQSASLDKLLSELDTAHDIACGLMRTRGQLESRNTFLSTLREKYRDLQTWRDANANLE